MEIFHLQMKQCVFITPAGRMKITTNAGLVRSVKLLCVQMSNIRLSVKWYEKSLHCYISWHSNYECRNNVVLWWHLHSDNGCDTPPNDQENIWSLCNTLRRFRLKTMACSKGYKLISFNITIMNPWISLRKNSLVGNTNCWIPTI